MKKYLFIFCLLICLALSACSRPGYQQTEATEQALETYYAAVKESEAQPAGDIAINIQMNDTIVAKKQSAERYEYSYTVQGENELFDYRCYDAEGALTAHYASTTEDTVVDKLTGAEVSNFDNYKKHASNPISNLKLFRMDANYKVRHEVISSITMQKRADATIITINFHPDKLTALSIKSEGGLNRTITSHQRVYTLRDGKIARIEIYDKENAQYKNETGTIDTDTIVEVSYK